MSLWLEPQFVIDSSMDLDIRASQVSPNILDDILEGIRIIQFVSLLIGLDPRSFGSAV